VGEETSNPTHHQQEITMLTIANLPALGEQLENGTFAGITTKPDGTHHAVVLLPDQGTELTWKKAMNWAKKLEAELPSRPVAALDQRGRRRLFRLVLRLRRRQPGLLPQELRRLGCCRPLDSPHRLILQSF